MSLDLWDDDICKYEPLCEKVMAGVTIVVIELRTRKRCIPAASARRNTLSVPLVATYDLGAFSSGIQ